VRVGVLVVVLFSSFCIFVNPFEMVVLL